MNLIKDIEFLYETLFKNKPECRYDGGPRFLPDEIFQARLNMMIEEIDEYQEAAVNKDLEGVLDALIDLMVFVCGTIYLHGMSKIFFYAWTRVLNANLVKRAGNKNRGTDCDMIKPEGWKPPTFEDLL